MPAYVLPTFNLVCEIGPSAVPDWPCSNAGFVARLSLVDCALVYGRRTNQIATGGTFIPGFPEQAVSLLLPALTDIRGPQDSTHMHDVVEVPSGSGRWYGVCFVDDIGKGYPNEHRTASIVALGYAWTAPYS